jgi:hypothetical protein
MEAPQIKNKRSAIDKGAHLVHTVAARLQRSRPAACIAFGNWMKSSADHHGKRLSGFLALWLAAQFFTNNYSTKRFLRFQRGYRKRGVK